MDSPNWGYWTRIISMIQWTHISYWCHSWPIEVQHIEDTFAERFGPEVWEEIKQFLDRGSVKEEIINSLIE